MSKQFRDRVLEGSDIQLKSSNAILGLNYFKKWDGSNQQILFVIDWDFT